MTFDDLLKEFESTEELCITDKELAGMTVEEWRARAIIRREAKAKAKEAASQQISHPPASESAPQPPLADMFQGLSDDQVPAKYQLILAKYRELATEHGVPTTTAVCYRVSLGFTLKTHAPQFGPCYDNFAHLQGWNFPDDPTQDSLVFWVPRILNGSKRKTKDQQLQFLAETRIRLDLPDHHLANFGQVSLLAGLILAHYKVTGERVPLDCKWSRTDTCYAGGRRLHLGYFDGADLGCNGWPFDGAARGSLGAFALGVEVLGT